MKNVFARAGIKVNRIMSRNFTINSPYDQISAKISEIVKPADMKAEVEVVFQTVENLHKAIPHHSGDWYFTGNYPTPGGMKVVNRAYANYMEGRLVRAY